MNLIALIIKPIITGLAYLIGQKLIAVSKSVKKEVVDLLNDTALKALARAAVVSAARKGLSGDAAWTDAAKEFADALRKRGEDIAENVRDTLLQTEYTSWKNSPIND